MKKRYVIKHLLICVLVGGVLGFTFTPLSIQYWLILAPLLILSQWCFLYYLPKKDTEKKKPKYEIIDCDHDCDNCTRI